MANMHPIMLLALVLLAAVALTQVPRVESAPDVAAVATPDHQPPLVSIVRQPAAEAVAMPKPELQPVEVAQKPTAETVAIPNHDPPRSRPAPSFALNTAMLQAGPEPAAPQAPAFVDADATVYAKDKARLRAAPSTAADVVTQLAADAPLRANGRSSDGAWWRVSLDGGRIGYVHRSAVTKHLIVAMKPPVAEPAPNVAVAGPQPMRANRSDGLLGTVEETMNWLADTAGRGSAPEAIRTER